MCGKSRVDKVDEVDNVDAGTKQAAAKRGWVVCA